MMIKTAVVVFNETVNIVQNLTNDKGLILQKIDETHILW